VGAEGANFGIAVKLKPFSSHRDQFAGAGDVTPISYAQCGLYFQFHRKEQNVYGNIAYLWRKKYGSEMKVRNVPNKYLEDARVFPPRM
jgi:hypothetical protein